MNKSEFLSDIAKKYSPQIEYVAFEAARDGGFGEARRSRNDLEKYYIHIDKNRLICSYQILYVFFHEIGHIVNFHLGYKYFNKKYSKEDKENEASIWAFKEMGMIDNMGNIKEEKKACHECMAKLCDKCLRGFKVL